MRRQIAELGKAVYAALGARDYGRIDIRMDSLGKPNFIEANLTPGIANNDFVSYFTRACELNQDMTYESMILRIVEIGLARSTDIGEDILEFDKPSLVIPVFKTVLGSAAKI